MLDLLSSGFANQALHSMFELMLILEPGIDKEYGLGNAMQYPEYDQVFEPWSGIIIAHNGRFHPDPMANLPNHTISLNFMMFGLYGLFILLHNTISENRQDCSRWDRSC